MAQLRQGLVRAPQQPVVSGVTNSRLLARAAGGAGAGVTDDLSLTLVAAEDAVVTAVVARDETLAATDSQAGALSAEASVSETLTLTTSTSATVVNAVEHGDTLAAVDDATSQMVAVAETSDTLAAADSQAAAATFASAQAESLALSDSASASHVAPVTVSDALAPSDSQTVSQVVPVTASDALTLEDAATATATMLAAQAEAVSASDSQDATLTGGGGGTVYNEAVGDTLAAVDTASAAVFSDAPPAVAPPIGPVGPPPVVRKTVIHEVTTADLLLVEDFTTSNIAPGLAKHRDDIFAIDTNAAQVIAGARVIERMIAESATDASLHHSAEANDMLEIGEALTCEHILGWTPEDEKEDELLVLALVAGL